MIDVCIQIFSLLTINRIIGSIFKSKIYSYLCLRKFIERSSVLNFYLYSSFIIIYSKIYFNAFNSIMLYMDSLYTCLWTCVYVCLKGFICFIRFFVITLYVLSALRKYHTRTTTQILHMVMGVFPNSLL